MTAPRYEHIQRAPLCVIVYAVAVAMLAAGLYFRDISPLLWLYPPISAMLLVLAASFHFLAITDRGDCLKVSFGPIPLIRRSIPYENIARVNADRTWLVEGWGVHLSLRGGWIWNLWGRDCVLMTFRDGTPFRLGTDDVENLVAFLNSKVASEQ
ncbi:MAG: hypothetical protein KDA81_19465 [Planctomycetaceae bacterium]|nr:hypothetical protein [Planctomycetaceae bacterium]